MLFIHSILDLEGIKATLPWKAHIEFSYDNGYYAP